MFVPRNLLHIPPERRPILSRSVARPRRHRAKNGYGVIWLLLRQGAPKGRQQKGETGPGTHIFADFCRFSLIFGSLCKSRDLGVADLRRKPQETADFRRKPQKTADFCRNRFLPFAVSLLARSFLVKGREKGIHHRSGKKGIHHGGLEPAKKGGFLR